MWLSYTGCDSHGSVHSKEDVGKVDGLETTQVQPEQSVSTVVNYDSDSTIAYDLEEVRIWVMKVVAIIVTTYHQALMRSLEL